MEKILTIVIPTYNMQDYLRRCLDSLIVPEEQMEQLEVLVVNDGSKDNSSAIAHEYQDKYPGTFRVIDKENGNYGSCVNRGLKEATGKYIKILDADDWFDTNNFQHFIIELKEIDADAVITDYTSYFPKETKNTSFGFLNRQYSFQEAFNEKGQELESVQMHAICYKKSCFDGLNYHQTEGISYTDQEWILLPWVNVNTLFYLPLSVYQYNLSREGQTCDLSVFYKKMPDQFLSVKSSIKSAIEHDSYMDNLHNKMIWNKIIARIESLYRFILVSQNKSPKYLVDFDKDIVYNYKNISLALDRACLHSYFPYAYIYHWRSKGYQPLSKMVLIVNKILSKMSSLVKLFRNSK